MESMGSEVPSTVLCSEGRSPEENGTVEGTEGHRFNWCLEKKEWYICFISLIYIWNLLVTFALFYVEHFQIILTCTGQ